MASLIDRCDSLHPHPDWDKLRGLPYADLSQPREWVQRPFREEPLETLPKVLWFGLFNRCPDGHNPTADIYVCGSERFVLDPHDNSWAVDPDWCPAARYANSAVLADIYRIAYRQVSPAPEQKECLGNDAEYPLVLGYGVFAVRELLGQQESLGVAVGFDSGDVVLLGKFTSGDLKPFDRNAERLDRAGA